MPQTFRLKIAARRQVTFPQELLELLNLSEGDILEITMQGDSIVGRGLKLVPSCLFTPDILEQLRKREAEMSEEEGTIELGAKSHAASHA
jgi:bifunctional DNA-binding transcriptional regulator/antitoxin component of YhaV-PrlF toxin-antitoxin module